MEFRRLAGAVDTSAKGEHLFLPVVVGNGDLHLDTDIGRGLAVAVAVVGRPTVAVFRRWVIIIATGATDEEINRQIVAPQRMRLGPVDKRLLHGNGCGMLAGLGKKLFPVLQTVISHHIERQSQIGGHGCPCPEGIEFDLIVRSLFLLLQGNEIHPGGIAVLTCKPSLLQSVRKQGGTLLVMEEAEVVFVSVQPVELFA